MLCNWHCGTDLTAFPAEKQMILKRWCFRNVANLQKTIEINASTRLESDLEF